MSYILKRSLWLLLNKCQWYEYNGKTNQKAIAVIQVRDNGDLCQGGNGRHNAKWSDFGYTLQVQTTRFPDEFDVGYERKVLKMTARFQDRANGKDSRWKK